MNFSQGRLTVHLITDGSQADQACEGDYLAKDERYRRTEEYIQIVCRASKVVIRSTGTGEFHHSRTSHPGCCRSAARRPGSPWAVHPRRLGTSGPPRRISLRLR
ncbi:LLM class flavin-dependent oxidoreductase [Arthrobacter sp. H-02-3]|uniref:LLM class flavin-dependent oxidoreductase n=1 Tax=Arthrobacter sp. H-02-3 TaxID=2703675 RepID=UPI000E324A94